MALHFSFKSISFPPTGAAAAASALAVAVV